MNYNHLTQNENAEKLTNGHLIGRFGVGLKDALATLYRHNIQVKIVSKHGVITLKEVTKRGFEDIITLHAQIAPSPRPDMAGTDVTLVGCTQEDMKKAQSLFLHFAQPPVLESPQYGDVLDKQGHAGEIFINGMKVAQEENFLFSYNITSLTAQLKKALNRERTNVGRSAYTGRVKDILKQCITSTVINALVGDLNNYSYGTKHDELGWTDIALHASIKARELQPKAAFVTPTQVEQAPSLIDDMKRQGLQTIIVPDTIVEKIEDHNLGVKDGDALITAQHFVQEQTHNFTPTPISFDHLSAAEQQIHNQTNAILDLIGGKPTNVQSIQIVEHIYELDTLDADVLGLWYENAKILIKRSQLQSMEKYANTLLHECAHAISGQPDVNRDFELCLSKIIGTLATKLLNKMN
ncbi:MAG: hypothetical protein IKW63_03620 [Elusimicrobiaceae bacterium]|nr:hypothetical protein [Elusimicrobiaceae bacterium]